MKSQQTKMNRWLRLLSVAGLVLGASLLATSARAEDGAPSDGDWTYMPGPCKKYWSEAAVVPKCFAGECSWWCEDPYGYVTSHDGFCKNQTGPCTQWTFLAEFEMYRLCSCVSSRCRNDGVEAGDPIAFTKCVDYYM